MWSELEALKDETASEFDKLLHELRAAQAELQATRVEFLKLQELHARARGEREEVTLLRALAALQLAHKDETTLLN
jgi:hypothetical protein